MKRIVAAVSVLVFLFVSTASAYEQIEVDLTTEQEIRFLGMPWGITLDQFKEEMERQIKYVSFEETNLPIKNDTQSSSFYDGTVFPCVRSNTLQTIELEVKASGYIKVAGHNVWKITSSFYNDESTSMYKVMYSFTDHNSDLSNQEIYDDLKVKLNNLFGEGYEYTGSGIYGVMSYRHCVWIGSNNTAVSLDLSMVGAQLTYGDSNSYYVFMEHEEEKAREKDKEHQDLLDSVSQKTNGL